MEVRHHPLYVRWLTTLAESDEEVFGEVMALETALEHHGRALGDPESHPVVSSPYDMHALRRTPPTVVTPYATDPPVLRVLYGYCGDSEGDEVAVALLGGDKTALANLWYPPNVAEAGYRLEDYCRRYPELKPIVL